MNILTARGIGPEKHGFEGEKYLEKAIRLEQYSADMKSNENGAGGDDPGRDGSTVNADDHKKALRRR